MNEQIVLGSGMLYVAPYDALTGIPDDAALEVEVNKLGLIKGGASLEYKPEEYEIFDDSYSVHERFVISEEVSFKTGVLTWNMETLNKLVAKSDYSDDTGTFVRTLKLGGVGARKMAKYVVRFVHDYGDAVGNKFRMTMVATASNGLSLAFAPDKETVVDAEFKAMAHGNDHVQLILSEGYGSGGTFAITKTIPANGVISNPAATIGEGAAYLAVVSAVNGKSVTAVVVKMGGTTITATAYVAATGVISIPNVTGALEITVTIT